VAGFEIGRHEWRGEEDDFEIFARGEAMAAEPAKEEDVVGGIAVGGGEGEWTVFFPSLSEEGGEFLSAAHGFRREIVGEGDGIAMGAQNQGHSDIAPDAAEAE
jgi:hypothetical protein